MGEVFVNAISNDESVQQIIIKSIWGVYLLRFQKRASSFQKNILSILTMRERQARVGRHPHRSHQAQKVNGTSVQVIK